MAATTFYAREIEEILNEHLAAREAAAVGIRNPAFGEDVGAAVALKACVAGARAQARVQAAARRRARRSR